MISKSLTKCPRPLARPAHLSTPRDQDRDLNNKCSNQLQQFYELYLGHTLELFDSYIEKSATNLAWLLIRIWFSSGFSWQGSQMIQL